MTGYLEASPAFTNDIEYDPEAVAETDPPVAHEPAWMSYSDCSPLTSIWRFEPVCERFWAMKSSAG